MNLTLPQLLPECESPSRQFCTTCRLKYRGQAFRQTILEVRQVEGVGADFKCPRGYPWIKESPRGLGDSIAAFTSKLGIGPCGGCSRRQAKLNKALPYGRDRATRPKPD